MRPVSKSFNAWNLAKKENRFSLFENELAELVELKKEETEILGYTEHPYDALMDEFEKGCTVKLVDKLFGNMLPKLRKYSGKNSTGQIHRRIHFYLNTLTKKKQWDFGMQVIAELGFDFEAGRQDLSSHPFSTSFNKNDVRITTRIDENDFSSMLFSCIHETGHALYEQGLPESEYGLPSGEFASLGHSRIPISIVGKPCRKKSCFLEISFSDGVKKISRSHLRMFQKKNFIKQ